MLFGVVNGPATFEGHIYSFLREYLDILFIAYLDDILIYSVDCSKYKEAVCLILKRLLKHSLFVKLGKCMLSVTEISFLGFILTTYGVRMEPSRVSIISEWPKPTTYREIQVLLRFANSYQRFIMGLSRIVNGLIGILTRRIQRKFKEVLFILTLEARTFFCNLQKRFTTALFLWQFDPLLPIWMKTDVSGFAIFAILPQAHLGTGHSHP